MPLCVSCWVATATDRHWYKQTDEIESVRATIYVQMVPIIDLNIIANKHWLTSLKLGVCTVDTVRYTHRWNDLNLQLVLHCFAHFRYLLLRAISAARFSSSFVYNRGSESFFSSDEICIFALCICLHFVLFVCWTIFLSRLIALTGTEKS